MQKIIRPTYPTEINVYLLSIIFVLSGFFSHQMFESHTHDPNNEKSVYFGMVLVGLAVVLMVLIIWEEILFPVKIKEIEGGMVFRNPQTKLIKQVFIYCGIVGIFTFIYFDYDVKIIHFVVWAAVCLIPPVIEKIISGINNYYDFLILTNKNIEYKNNEKVGRFEVSELQNIEIVNDDRKVISKLQLLFKNNDRTTIDLDEMELEAFYGSIRKFINTNYKHLLKEADAVAA